MAVSLRELKDLKEKIIQNEKELDILYKKNEEERAKEEKFLQRLKENREVIKRLLNKSDINVDEIIKLL